LVIEAYNGLTVVSSQSFDLATGSPVAPFSITAATGMSSLLFRKAGPVEAATFDPGPAVELVLIRYRTMREVAQIEADKFRCDAQNDSVHGEGRLAWLPNTDYEVTIRTRVTLGYTAT